MRTIRLVIGNVISLVLINYILRQWNAQHHQSHRLLELCKEESDSNILFISIIILVHPLLSMKPDISNVFSHAKAFHMIVNYVTLAKLK